MFDWLFRRSIPIRKPATGWMVRPAAWEGDYCVTPWWEDLPERCYDCGTETVRKEAEPLMIEGKIQFMKVTQSCPRGCGRTDWIA